MGATQSQVAPAGAAQPAVKDAPKPTEKGGSVVSNGTRGTRVVVKEVVKPNDYELAIKSCKELEFILETEFGSTGSTLHEMITNANASLPIELIMNMRYVATIGNNLVHEKSFSYIPDQAEFMKRYERSVKALQEISQQRRIVERRVGEAKRKQRAAEIEEELMNEDKEWIEKKHQEVTAQKARKLELEREKQLLEQQRKELEAQNRSRMCVCF